MNDTNMTVVGNVVDAPRMRLTKNGHAVTNFRIASTSRRFDREQERYVDNATLFVNVTCWRAMAENVAQSLIICSLSGRSPSFLGVDRHGHVQNVGGPSPSPRERRGERVS